MAWAGWRYGQDRAEWDAAKRRYVLAGQWLVLEDWSQVYAWRRIGWLGPLVLSRRNDRTWKLALGPFALRWR